MAYYGDPFPPYQLPMHYQPPNREAVVVKILQLKQLGDFHCENRTSQLWHHDALACYEEALGYCEVFQIVPLMADIYWRLASVKLEVAEKGVNYESRSEKRKILEKLFNEADKHSNKCIDLDKSSSKGYYYRAVSKYLRAVWLECTPSPSTVEDFIKAYRLELQNRTGDSVEPLCQALFIAVDHGLVSSLKLDFLDSDVCANLLKAVLKNDTSKVEHIDYLFHEKDGVEGSGLASRLSVSFADLSLGSLHSKWYSSEKIGSLVRLFIEKGMQLTTNDVKIAIQESKDLELLKLVMENAPDFTDTEACELCLSYRNFPFASHFLSVGAKPSHKSVIENMMFPYKAAKSLMPKQLHDDFLSYLEADPGSHEIIASKALSCNCFDTFKQFTPGLSSDSIKSLCEQALVKRKKRFFDYLMKKHEANPNAVVVMDSLAWHHLDKDLLEYLVCIPSSHQEMASRAINHRNIEILRIFALLLDKESCSALCEQALVTEMSIAVYLMKNCNANPRPSAVIDALDWDNLDEAMLDYLAACEAHIGALQLIVRAIQRDRYDIVTRFAMDLKPNESICDLIKLYGLLQTTNLASHPDVFERLLEIGADPNCGGSENEGRPLDVALTLDISAKVQIITSLVKHGADLSLCTTAEPTLIHVVTELAFESSNSDVLEVVCKVYKFPEDGKLVDKSDKTPFHLAMKHKQGRLCEKIISILCQYCIDPDILDDHGQKAYYVVKGKGDKRVKLLQEHCRKFKEAQKRKMPKKSKSRSRNANSISQTTAENNEREKSPKKEEVAEAVTESSRESENSKLSESEQLKDLLDMLHSKKDSYFKGSQQPYKRQASSHESNSKGASTHIEPHNKDGGAALPIKKEEVETDKALEVRFEDLVWEVECPEKVVKFLKNERHPAWLRELAITKIRQLAEGDLRGKGIKSVYKDASKNFCLYEMRLTDAARILWERAVQFSPRLTAKGTDKSCETAKGSNKSCEAAVHLYSEVIRVWDIVLDHDNVNRSISYVKKSNERGCKAAVKYHLENPKSTKNKKARNQEQKGLQYPEVYLVGKDIDQQEVAQIAERIFVPAGSTKEDEYNVITFYSFTSSFVKSLLEGEHARRDFPYKEWPKEHDIINMPQHEESILLLGRSGTGKTTCCLYRLWNHFQTYWLMAENSGPTFPRAPLTLLANQVTEACAANADSELDSSSGSITELDPSQDVCTTDTAAQPEDAQLQADEELEADEEPRPKNILEHLHQVFITKNYVLCAQMKKRFYDLAAGNDIAKEHMRYEDVEETPINISDLNDQAYPIFLTARQFFILLDNSLEDRKQFFPRDEDGKLKEKIISSDYDHENPDTLLDLEESDSEEEMDDGGDFEDETRAHRTAKKQQVPERKEVTAFYFAEKIWSEIKHASSEKKLDPLLVWMEIKSFIKGSKDALQCEEGFLSEESYIKLIGEKRASNFVGKREELYKLFKAYDRILKLTATESLFDDCDFIHNIHARLDMMQDLPWSIHSIYIDEVQDFTQAELALLLRCCRHPNGLFLTGDTAQSIMRGIAFRFSDLRTLFHDANEKAKAVKGAIPVKVPEVHKLTINFRSHSGILELASSIIDLLRNFFPDSFDSLPDDEGMFQGPVPVLLESSSISDLAILLRGNKRQSSSIEFGAHQVIIVQSEEAKQSLPDALKAGNVLTVFESKGLEFDDVILYDFFKNSKVTKEWRVITTFIENDPRLKKRNKSDFASEPRSLKFDELQHKSLNAELKYLYTAITRAKCNLWIYDSDQLNRLPMFDYWVKRELVKVVNVDLTKDDQNVLFAVQSSKDEWKIQGDYFKKKGLWEPAMKCYWKAGNVRLEKETEAYFLAKQAKTFSQKPKEMQLHFLRAAIAFLECDKSSHDVSCLEKAAKCLKNSKSHSEAAKLYTRLNQPDKAAAQFKRSNDIDGYVKFKEMNGQYNEAVQLYVKKNRRLEALQLAEGYEQNGITLSHGLAAIDLALKFAKFYTEKGNTQRLLKVIDYIPDVPVQVDILKKAGMFKEACDLLVGAKQFSEAYQLYRVQGEYQAAIELAVKQKDQEKQEKLTLWYAISLLAKDSGKLDAAVNDSLIQLSKSGTNCEHKALAYLLLGRINKNVGFCKEASRLFANLKVPHTVGQMEACVAQLEFEKVPPRIREDDVRNVLHACQLVSTVSGCCRSKESKRTPTQTKSIHQMEVLYSLERHQSSYACFKEEITFWMGKCFKPHQYSDSDGQLVVSMEDVMALVIQRMNGVIERWIMKDGLEVVQHLKTRAKSFPFNEQLSKSGHLRKSFLEYPHNEVTSYLRVCNDAAKVQRLAPNSTSFSSEIIVRVILNFLSPPASMYMPISKSHLRRLCNVSDALKSFLNTKAREFQTTSDSDFNMDRWLEVWRIHCAFETVPDLEYHFTKRPVTSEKAYYFYQDGYYDHYLALWLKSCRLIAKESKVITSFKIAVHFIVKRFAQKSEIRATLSTANLLHILCIHSTALLAVSKVCADRLYKKSSRVYVPSLYVHVVRVFDLMNCHSQDRKTLFQACFEDGIVIKEAAKGPQFLHKLLRDVQNHLREVLGILTGNTYPQLRPLHSVMTEESIANGDAKHCVMLTLTLFANLALTDCTDEELHQLRVQIKHAIQPLLQQTGAGSELLKKSYSLFAGQNSIAGTFMALDQLLTSVGSNTYVAEMTTSYKERKPPTFSFSPVTFPHYPRRTVTPLPVIEIRDNIKFPERTDSTRNVWGVKRSISQPANPQESVKTESVVETTQVEYSSSAELPESKASLELKENLEGIENDEDVQEALKLAASAPLARKPTQEAIAMPLGQDQSLIDDNFCQICAVALQAKKEVVEPELPTLKTEEQHEEPTSPVVTIERSLSRDSEEVETPDAHCKSQKHIEQCKLRDRYLRQRSEEYLPLKTKLMEMKETLASFDIQFALKTVLVQIEKEIENNEKYFETIELSAEWREGCSKIDYEIIGRVESLLQTSEKELEKAKKVRDHESKLPALPVSEDEEDVVAGEERLEEVEEPASSAVQQKGRSRARKRHKNSKKRK